MSGIAINGDMYYGNVKCYPHYVIDDVLSDANSTTFVREYNGASSDDPDAFDHVTFHHDRAIIIPIGKGWYGIVMKHDIVDLFPAESELYALEESNE